MNNYYRLVKAGNQVLSCHKLIPWVFDPKRNYWVSDEGQIDQEHPDSKMERYRKYQFARLRPGKKI